MTDPLQQTLTITNRRGLHARASAKFVSCVEGFDARVKVSKDGVTVDGTSIMGLLMLCATPGTSIHVAADGPEAEAAIAALTAMVEAKFDED